MWVYGQWNRNAHVATERRHAGYRHKQGGDVAKRNSAGNHPRVRNSVPVNDNCPVVRRRDIDDPSRGELSPRPIYLTAHGLSRAPH